MDDTLIDYFERRIQAATAILPYLDNGDKWKRLKAQEFRADIGVWRAQIERLRMSAIAPPPGSVAR